MNIDTQQARLMADSGFLQALEAIRRQARMRNQTNGFEDLSFYAYLSVRRARSRGKQARTPKQHWEECWSRDTDKTWKALTEFPDRVRKMAAQVKGVSRSPYFDPGRAIRAELVPWADFSNRVFRVKEDEFVDFAKRQFRLLPATLEWYADWLEVQVKGTAAIMKHFYRRTPRKHSAFIHEVSNEAKRITGRFCDPQVAALLNAADRVVNPDHRDEDDRFDEQTINLLRSRRKRKSSKT